MCLPPPRIRLGNDTLSRKTLFRSSPARGRPSCPSRRNRCSTSNASRMQVVAVEGHVLRRAEPEVVVDARRDRQRCRPFTNGARTPYGLTRAETILPRAAPRANRLISAASDRIAAAFRLADLPVFGGGGNRLPAFPLIVRQRFLDVHVLPGWHGPDGRQAVPVIAGGDHHRVDALVVQQASQVGLRLGVRLCFCLALPSRSSSGSHRPAVANPGDLAKGPHQFPAAAAATDETQVDRVVGVAARSNGADQATAAPAAKPRR